MTSNSSQPLEIQAEGISCARDDQIVFSGLNFEVGAGSCLEVAGPNGSGKTTLLRTIAGIDPVARGTLRVPHDELVFLGHRDGLKPDLTAGDNLRFWAGIHGHRVDPAVLDRFGLTPLIDRQVRRLSAGQRKRVALASAISSGARVWLLDEPLTSLDSDGAETVAAELSMHCRSGGIAVVTALQFSLSPDVRINLAQLNDDTSPARASR